MEDPMRLILAVTASVFLIQIFGCGAPSRQVDYIQVAHQTKLERLAFGDYWQAERVTGGGDALGRFAIASFQVEFVEERVTPPDQYSQSDFTTNFGAVKNELPNRLYDLFTKRNTAIGRQVIPASQVKSAHAYAQYPRSKSKETLTLFDIPIPSAAGEIRRIDTRTAEGLVVIDPANPAIETVDTALANELGVESIVHVIIRLGVWQGRALIEDGCKVLIHGVDGQGILTSIRPLAGEHSVLQSREFAANISGQFNVEARRYYASIDRVFPVYISLATEEVRR